MESDRREASHEESNINTSETLNLFSAIVAAIFVEAMPFLVIGALLSATIEVFVSTERLLRHIPKSVAGGLAFGIGSGFILPTCECGVVPIVRRLMHKGVPPFIAIAYMLAAPIVNPVVLASTYLAFRGSLTMVFARIVMATVTATVLGLYARRLREVLPNAEESGGCDHNHNHDHSGEPFSHKIRSVMIHAAHEFMDMGKFLIVGAMAAAAFKTLLPENIMSFFSGNLELSIIGMMILAILLSICSEADAFVAASFQVFPTASKLAFVGIGPMVDLKLIGMYAVTFNRKMLAALVVGPSVLIFLLSWLFGQMGL
jgi:uncharacterized membrane protein YraQ (UPF0718 family)